MWFGRRETKSEAFRMPMTQVWIHTGTDWKCLAPGHAGPRLS